MVTLVLLLIYFEVSRPQLLEKIIPRSRELRKHDSQRSLRD